MNKELILMHEMQQELEENILPFWMNNMLDLKNGGFYGQIDGQNKLHPEANKGAILHARILWTFSSAYRLLKKTEYLNIATHAKRFLIDKFYDQTNGGIYWEVDYTGNPIETKKQIYALGFAIYGLSEYARATHDKKALDYAIRLFKSIEEHSFDKTQNGYFEAFTKEWDVIEDMRLSEKDENEKKTMNTHLHILEPYTNLYRIWKDDSLKKQIINLINLFTNRILNPSNGHLGLFFDEEWNKKSDVYSFGHDIEASWLIYEAALVINEQKLLEEIRLPVQQIAKSAKEGLMANGGLIYEYIPRLKEAKTEFHWWVQAENVVGHINLYQYFKDHDALDIACKSWEFIKNELIDQENGEWFWGSYLDHTVNRQEDKAGFWKCPYHNGRMCMEIIERFNNKKKATV